MIACQPTARLRVASAVLALLGMGLLRIGLLGMGLLGIGLLGMGLAAPRALVATAADFQAAYAAADQAEQQAGTLQDRWTVTETALKEAKQAAGAGQFDQAVSLAHEAETLANLSIAQARAQQTAWRDAVVH